MIKTSIDEQVPTPTVGDRPNFMSAPIAQGLLLYKGFAIGATQRIMISGMQQRDARVLAGALSSVALAYVFAGPAGGEYDKHPIASSGRLATAIEKSGITGLFSDVNRALEMLSSNELGMRPMLGIDAPLYAKNPTWAQKAGEVAGPAISPWLNTVWALTTEDAKTDARAGALRRNLWFNNLLWFALLTRALQREASSTIDDLTD